MGDEVKLINVDELKYIESDANAYTEEWNADYEKGFSDCLDKVMALPTFEACLVKQGRWEINTDGCLPFCSNCKYEPPKELIGYNALNLEPITTKYCPNCGSENGTKIHRVKDNG